MFIRRVDGRDPPPTQVMATHVRGLGTSTVTAFRRHGRTASCGLSSDLGGTLDGDPCGAVGQPGLGPSVALVQDADVRADDRGLGRGDLAPAVTTAAHHKAARQVTV